MSELDKNILKKVLVEETERLKRLEINEKYYQRCVIAQSNNSSQLILGKVQSRIKGIKNYIEFLEEQLK